MKSSIKCETSYKSAKYLVLIFIVSALLSYSYSLITGRFNGDFLGRPVELSNFVLVVNLFCSLLPFYITWHIYKKYKSKKRNKRIYIPMNFFGFFILFILVWHIVVTLLFGVGVMAAPPYEAPHFIKPIIQIMNRLNYSIGALLYILVSPKKSRVQFLVVFLFIVIAFLRAGLGVFLYLGMVFLIKYFTEIKLFVSRRKITVLAILLIFPFFVSGLYDLRSELRHDPNEDLPLLHFLFGRLTGRLSSVSDSAIILQEAEYFKENMTQMDDYYFQKQALGGVFGVKYMPSPRPEQILFWLYCSRSEMNVAYMPGTQGALFLSYIKSHYTFIINLITYFVLIFLTFWSMRLLKFEYSNEFALLLLLYVLLSGVPNEYSFQIFSILVYVLVFGLYNSLKKVCLK